jgi:hypothetical protein
LFQGIGFKVIALSARIPTISQGKPVPMQRTDNIPECVDPAIPELTSGMGTAGRKGVEFPFMPGHTNPLAVDVRFSHLPVIPRQQVRILSQSMPLQGARSH